MRPPTHGNHRPERPYRRRRLWDRHHQGDGRSPPTARQFGAAAEPSPLRPDRRRRRGSARVVERRHRDPTATAPPVPPTPAPAAIDLKVTGKDKGKTDKVKVNANGKAEGLVAKVFKGNKKIASHKLDGSGNFTFSVKDKNGKDKTKYTVKVAKTSKTKAAEKSVKIK